MFLRERERERNNYFILPIEKETKQIYLRHYPLASDKKKEEEEGGAGKERNETTKHKIQNSHIFFHVKREDELNKEPPAGAGGRGRSGRERKSNTIVP